MLVDAHEGDTVPVTGPEEVVNVTELAVPVVEPVVLPVVEVVVLVLDELLDELLFLHDKAIKRATAMTATIVNTFFIKVFSFPKNTLKFQLSKSKGECCSSGISIL